jgi:hypothetical protein
MRAGAGTGATTGASTLGTTAGGTGDGIGETGVLGTGGGDSTTVKLTAKGTPAVPNRFASVYGVTMKV